MGKLTDNDIIKALECCKMPVGSGACNNCPLKDVRDNLKKEDTKSCTTIAIESALDLINFQKEEIKKLENIERLATKTIETQTAEIERLQIRNKTLAAITKNYDWKFAKAKSEAIKEFAERLKAKVENIPWCEYHLVHTEVDNLVKEMVGE